MHTEKTSGKCSRERENNVSSVRWSILKGGEPVIGASMTVVENKQRVALHQYGPSAFSRWVLRRLFQKCLSTYRLWEEKHKRKLAIKDSNYPKNCVEEESTAFRLQKLVVVGMVRWNGENDFGYFMSVRTWINIQSWCLPCYLRKRYSSVSVFPNTAAIQASGKLQLVVYHHVIPGWVRFDCCRVPAGRWYDE